MYYYNMENTGPNRKPFVSAKYQQLKRVIFFFDRTPQMLGAVAPVHG